MPGKEDRQPMSIKDELFKIRNEQREIIELKERIDTEYNSLLPSGIRYDTDKVQTSPEDHMTKTMAEIDDHMRILSDRLSHLLTRKRRAEKIIGTLEDSRQRQALTLYFLTPGTEKGRGYRMTMEEVADRMGYSHGAAYGFYAEGLRILEEMQTM